jgi:hypothetical protein
MTRNLREFLTDDLDLISEDDEYSFVIANSIIGPILIDAEYSSPSM